MPQQKASQLQRFASLDALACSARKRRSRSRTSLACSGVQVRKPSPVFMPSLPALTFSLQERMRAGAAVEVGDQHVADVEREVEPDEIGLLQRAEHRHAGAEAALHHGVDGLGIADTRRQASAIASRFKRVLQPVADEARNVAAHVDGLAAGGCAGVRWCGGRRRPRSIRSGSPRPAARDAAGSRSACRPRARDASGCGRSRSTGSPSCCWRGWSSDAVERLELGEDALLELELLRRRLEHERRRTAPRRRAGHAP